jgi:hypothetical protein
VTRWDSEEITDATSIMQGLPVLLHFSQSSLNEGIRSEGLLPNEEDDILKQAQAFFCT